MTIEKNDFELAPPFEFGSSKYVSIKLSTDNEIPLDEWKYITITATPADAVFIGNTTGESSDLARKLLSLCPGMDNANGVCPLYDENRVQDNCDCDTWSLSLLIIHLNDDHRWSREQIADWLESLDVDLSVVYDVDNNDTALAPGEKE